MALRVWVSVAHWACSVNLFVRRVVRILQVDRATSHHVRVSQLLVVVDSYLVSIVICLL